MLKEQSFEKMPIYKKIFRDDYVSASITPIKKKKVDKNDNSNRKNSQ